MRISRNLGLFVILAVVLACLSLLSLLTGPTGFFDPVVLTELRLPRLICGISVGGGLAVSGLLIQSALGNPLADSFSTGVAPAAALGAIVGGMFFAGGAIVGGFVFSFAGIFVLCVLLRKWFHDSVRLLLAGLILGFTSGSAATLVLYLSEPSAWASSVTWMLGSLRLYSLSEATALSLAVLTLIVVSWFHSKPLDIMRLDPVSANSVGVNVSAFRMRFFVLASAITALSTCMGGIVAFIGLLVPHLLQMLGIFRHRLRVPMAFLLGAIMYLSGDLLGRSLSQTIEVPAGIVISLLGAPAFLWIMLQGITRVRASGAMQEQ